MEKVYDAEGKIAGRLATKISRDLKDGKTIKVVNSEKAVVSGSKEEVLSDFKQKYERGSKYTGPHYPKSPERILKRIIRGMLPDNSEGNNFLQKVKTYIGRPEEFEEVVSPDTKEGEELRNKNYVKLSEVSKHIGWEKRGE